MKKLGFWVRFRRAVFGWFAPRDALCAFCDRDAVESADVQGGSACVCATCAMTLPPAPLHLSPIEGIDGIVAAFCFEEPVRSLIHRLKYDNRRYLARFAAVWMAAALANLPLSSDAVFVAVPLHPRRKRERTFNQSSEIATELCSVTGVPVLAKALRRNRYTAAQTHLSAAERKVNLQGAFSASPVVAGRSVILVDDVSTTGSTLSECAKTLRAAGATEVFAVVLAATGQFH